MTLPTTFGSVLVRHFAYESRVTAWISRALGDPTGEAGGRWIEARWILR